VAFLQLYLKLKPFSTTYEAFYIYKNGSLLSSKPQRQKDA